MRYIITVFFALLILAGCSSTKDIETASLNQAPCKDEMQITDPKVFTGETAENLQVYQQGDLLFAAMDIRTYCNARITFDVERREGELRLKVNRAAAVNDNCVCITNVTTSLKNIEPGLYNVMVMNSTGSQVLAQKDFSVK